MPSLENSRFLQLVRSLQQEHEQIMFNSRALTPPEIARLEAQGNHAPDWSSVTVAPDFDPAFVVGNTFFGRCVLGSFSLHPGRLDGEVALPSGVYHTTVMNSVIGNNSAIHRCPLICGYRIGHDVVISDSRLIFGIPCSFGNGASVSAGIETGGRMVPLLADLTLEAAAKIAAHPGNGKLAAEIDRYVEQYARRCQLSYGIVGEFTEIGGTHHIENVWIGPSARISSAGSLKDATILSASDEQSVVRDGASLFRAVLQEGCEVSTGAIVSHSLLFEHSSVERHAKVTESVIGPNSVIGEGEVTASFVGPFTALHHHSLLIAAYWPEGKGNIGYGANVGSNHTSRVPDQEIWPGEGMFFGLGCSVKFPANFRSAPYTVIATGVITLPQRVEFPFSLITEPSTALPGIPRAYNRLLPAWSLSDNLYALMRNEVKYAVRNQARRSSIPTELFRPDIVEMMKHALTRLEEVAPQREYYTEEHIEGLGKNVLLEEDRLRAVDTYRRFISYASLNERRRAYSAMRPQELQAQAERVREDLTALQEMLARTEKDTAASREKDQRRGTRIIDDYRQTHPALENDPFIVELLRKHGEERAEIERILARLS